MSRKGFTLIELLVVVAVLALLASIVFSNLGGAREGARISNALSFQSQTHSLLGSDLVGWWNFNEGSGTTVYDSSGYGSQGTLYNFSGDYWVNGVPGTGGTSLKFNGSNTYVRVIGDNINGGSWAYPEASFSFWINPNNNAGTSDQNMVTIENAFEIAINNKLNGYSSIKYASTPWAWRGNEADAVTNGTWNHITYTHALIGRKVYVNGVEVYTSSNTGALNPGSSSYPYMTIGGRYTGTSASTNGFIDDLRIYSRPLSAKEVETLYAQTKDKYLANE